jgi:hypothetical protein
LRQDAHTIVASLDSFALSREFPYSAEVGWEFVAPNDGEYTYTAAAAIRDVLVTVQGDVVGVSEGVVLADTYYIGLETTREIPAGGLLEYQSTVNAVLHRVATLQYVGPCAGASLPLTR